MVENSNDKIGIYIFRRDLRLDDNYALNMLIKKVDIIIPIFLLDEHQIIKTNKNKYHFSSNVIQFMVESLNNLNTYLEKKNSKLRLFYGKPENLIENIIKWIKLYLQPECTKITIGFNEDFSKYSIERDNLIKNALEKSNIDVILYDDDFTMCNMNLLVKEDKTPYKQYGAFRDNMLKSKSKFNKSSLTSTVCEKTERP